MDKSLKVLLLFTILSASFFESTIITESATLNSYKGGEGVKDMYILEDKDRGVRVSFAKNEAGVWSINFELKIADGWENIAYYKDDKPWRIYSGWENDWFSKEYSFGIEKITQLDENHIKATGEGEIDSHIWIFEDIYSIEEGLIKIERKWNHKDDRLQSYVTLENSIQVYLDEILRAIMPGIIYNDNPSALPERTIPRFPYENGSLSLYEEHRFPIPFVNAEYTLKDRAFYVSLLTLPSQVPFGHREDQWWSLGGEIGENRLIFLNLSGPVASNGKKSVVYGHQNNFDSYDEAYLDIPGRATLSKTFFIDVGELKRFGYSFRETVYKAYKVFKPKPAESLSSKKALDLKLNYAKSLYVNTQDACGFLFDSDISRPVLSYGWVGQNLVLAYSILAFSLENNDKDWMDKTMRVVDFYLNNSQTGVPGLRFVEYNFWTQTWSGDGNSNLISTRQYGETLDSLADLIFLGKKYFLDIDGWLGALREAGDFLIKIPRFNGLFPRFWETNGKPFGWEEDTIYRNVSTSGTYLIAPLAKLYILTEDIIYLKVAEDSAKSYWEFNAKDLSCPYWGATLDAGCEDKEAGAGFLHACIALYQATKDPKYLDWAKDAADWLLTFIYFYNTGFREGTPCYERIDTTGWTSVSVQNHHIDVWGNFMVSDFIKLGKFTGEVLYEDVGKMLFFATLQGIATKEYMWGYEREGDQSEQFCQTNYYQDGTRGGWRGGFSHWHPAWIPASTLVAGVKLKYSELP